MHKLFLIISIFIFWVSCDSGGKAPTQIEDDPPDIDKSSKRGVAYSLTDTADFNNLKSSVSWWYNWYFKTDAPVQYYSDYQMEFIPMVWGGNISETDITNIISFILDHDEIEYLLVMNEPNLTDQANRTPVQAANDWLDYEHIINTLSSLGRIVYLVGPAMTWGTMDNYRDPLVWLDAFYDAYRSANDGQEPLIDYLAFHWYDYGLEAQLNRMQKYDKQIWITEMANWNPQVNSYEKQIVQMKEMVAICEYRDDVFRYAWFIGRGTLPDNHYTYLFESDMGQLTKLGEVYINLPYVP